MFTLPLKSLWSVFFFLISKKALNESKATVKTFTLLQKILLQKINTAPLNVLFNQKKKFPQKY